MKLVANYGREQVRQVSKYYKFITIIIKQLIRQMTINSKTSKQSKFQTKQFIHKKNKTDKDTRVSNAPQTRVDPPRIGPYPKLTNPQDPQYLGPKICKPKPAPQWDFTGQARGLRYQLPSLTLSNKVP